MCLISLHETDGQYSLLWKITSYPHMYGYGGSGWAVWDSLPLSLLSQFIHLKMGIWLKSGSPEPCLRIFSIVIQNTVCLFLMTTVTCKVWALFWLTWRKVKNKAQRRAELRDAENKYPVTSASLYLAAPLTQARSCSWVHETQYLILMIFFVSYERQNIVYVTCNQKTRAQYNYCFPSRL